MQPVMSISELHSFLAEVFPQVCDDFNVEEITEDGITIRLRVGERHLRPGGTVSGPSMFGLADVSFYVTLLTEIGPEALAVTTNISMDFMRKPDGDRGLYAETRLLKVGRVLAVGDVLLFSDGLEKPVARAGMTYSIPPK